jgi:hypothetical protein
MSSFEYLGILVSVVLGLAITRLTAGTSQSIKRSDVRLFWVQLSWTFGIWLYVLAIWWGMVSWDLLDEWTFPLFLFIMFYATVLYLLADALYPHRMPPGTDLEEHFYSHRRWFFGLLAVGGLVDIPETVLKETMGLREVPTAYFVFVGAWLLVAVAGFVSTNRKVHAVLAVGWPLMVLTYLTGSLYMLWQG